MAKSNSRQFYQCSLSGLLFLTSLCCAVFYYYSHHLSVSSEAERAILLLNRLSPKEIIAYPLENDSYKITIGDSARIDQNVLDCVSAISRAYKINLSIFKYETKHGLMLISNTNLRSLQLSGSITVRDVTRILIYSKSLEHLSLTFDSYCVDLNSEIQKLNSLTSLHSLSIDQELASPDETDDKYVDLRLCDFHSIDNLSVTWPCNLYISNFNSLTELSIMASNRNIKLICEINNCILLNTIENSGAGVNSNGFIIHIK